MGLRARRFWALRLPPTGLEAHRTKLPRIDTSICARFAKIQVSNNVFCGPQDAAAQGLTQTTQVVATKGVDRSEEVMYNSEVRTYTSRKSLQGVVTVPDRKPPAKTGDPACGARATCRADTARTWRRSGTLSGLLLALFGVGLALATPRKSPAAPKRKNVPLQRETRRTISELFLKTWGPQGRVELLNSFSTPDSQSRDTAVTSRVTPESGGVRLCRMPWRRTAGRPWAGTHASEFLRIRLRRALKLRPASLTPSKLWTRSAARGTIGVRPECLAALAVLFNEGVVP